MKKNFFSFFKIKKGKKQSFLVLDIGSQGIKGLILEKEDKQKKVKRFASKSFEKFGAFQTVSFEKDLLEKNLSQVLKELKPGSRSLPETILIGLSPEILKGRIIASSFKRDNPEKVIEEKEKNIISDWVLNEAQKKAAEAFREKSGISVNEFQALRKKIIERKISGYKVPSILGFKGEIFDFEILVVFTLKNYFRIFDILKKSLNFERITFIHKGEGLISWLKNKKNFSGTFIDIGSRFTQVFLVEDGLLKWITEFEGGGDIFTQTLSENIGLSQKEGEDLKLRFSKGELSSGSQKIIRELLYPPLNSWFKTLKQELEQGSNKFHFVFPPDFYLFGGGSLLPGLKRILKKGDWENLSILNSPKVRFILPKDLPIGDESGFLKSPEETGIVFLALSI